MFLKDYKIGNWVLIQYSAISFDISEIKNIELIDMENEKAIAELVKFTEPQNPIVVDSHDKWDQIKPIKLNDNLVKIIKESHPNFIIEDCILSNLGNGLFRFELKTGVNKITAEIKYLHQLQNILNQIGIQLENSMKGVIIYNFKNNNILNFDYRNEL